MTEVYGVTPMANSEMNVPQMEQPRMVEPAREKYKPINSEGEFPITSISELEAFSQGSIVRLPDFADGQPFVAKVRRPSMMMLAMSGKIPNKLLTAANELFTQSTMGDVDDEDMLSKMFELMEHICRAALVQPTYDDIKKAGIELADDQYIAIFNYTQTGVKALESFREE